MDLQQKFSQYLKRECNASVINNFYFDMGEQK